MIDNAAKIKEAVDQETILRGYVIRYLDDSDEDNEQQDDESDI